MIHNINSKYLFNFQLSKSYIIKKIDLLLGIIKKNLKAATKI